MTWRSSASTTSSSPPVPRPRSRPSPPAAMSLAQLAANSVLKMLTSGTLMRKQTVNLGYEIKARQSTSDRVMRKRKT